jgi:tetratricopeptide (TPR) repeat protein
MVRQGVADLQQAATLDDTYGDPHCLLAVSGGNFLDPPDKELVGTEGALCLALNPPQEMVPMIQGLVARMSGETTTTLGGDDVANLLVTADAQQNAGDYSGALATYQRVLQLDPGNLSAQAQSAYLVALNGRNTSNQDQVQQGIELLKTMVARNADFADAHCLLALAAGYLLDKPDSDLARAEGERCLALDAPADMAPLVQDLVDELRAAG